MNEPRQPHNHRIVVAGAGIVGAALAWELARNGALVTLIDKAQPAAAASGASFGWLNPSFDKTPFYYHRLSREGTAAWRELELDVPVRWGGTLAFGSTTELTQLVNQQQGWGTAARLLDPSAVRGLAHAAPPAPAAYLPLDGWLDPLVATQRLVAAAEAAGAKLMCPCVLLDPTGPSRAAGRVPTSLGEIEARTLVLACGAESPLMERWANTPLPQRSTAGVLAVTEPQPDLFDHILVNSRVHVLQRNDGRLVIGANQPYPAPPDTKPTAATLQQAGHALLADATAAVPAVAGATLERTTFGWRPMPADGYPVVGASPHHPNVYVAFTHSGVTLALVIARLAAAEILRGAREPVLAPYRPQRFATSA